MKRRSAAPSVPGRPPPAPLPARRHGVELRVPGLRLAQREKDEEEHEEHAHHHDAHGAGHRLGQRGGRADHAREDHLAPPLGEVADRRGEARGPLPLGVGQEVAEALRQVRQFGGNAPDAIGEPADEGPEDQQEDEHHRRPPEPAEPARHPPRDRAVERQGRERHEDGEDHRYGHRCHTPQRPAREEHDHDGEKAERDAPLPPPLVRRRRVSLRHRDAYPRAAARPPPVPVPRVAASRSRKLRVHHETSSRRTPSSSSACRSRRSERGMMTARRMARAISSMS
jgi:hypothetical protein